MPARSAVLGAVLLGLGVLAGVGEFHLFYRAYLIAYLLWLGVALGCWQVDAGSTLKLLEMVGLVPDAGVE